MAITGLSVADVYSKHKDSENNLLEELIVFKKEVDNGVELKFCIYSDDALIGILGSKMSSALVQKWSTEMPR